MNKRKRKIRKLAISVVVIIVVYLAGVASSAFKVGTDSWAAAIVQNYILRGRVHVELQSIQRFDIDELMNTLRELEITDIDRSLDDPIVKDYYLVRLSLSTGGTSIEAPLEVELELGSEHAKIIDAINRVQQPYGRRISIRDSLSRDHEWVPLDTPSTLRFSWDSKLEGVAGFNVYRSFDKELGYGRINAETIKEVIWSPRVYHAPDLNPVFYKVSTVSVSGSESELSEVIELPNIAPLISYTKKSSEGESENLSKALIQQPTDHSSVRWSFDSGIEQGVKINLYAIVKVAPGGVFSPRIGIVGSKNTLSSTRGFGGDVRYITSVREIEAAQRRITPDVIGARVFGKTVLLHLGGVDDSESLTYRVFRSRIRDIGIHDDLGEELTDIFIHRGEVEFNWKERRVSLIDQVLNSSLISIFDVKAPANSNRLNVAAEVGEVPPPTNARMYISTTSNGVFIVDNPADGVTDYTYTIFVSSDRSEVSVPVVVNISLLDALNEASFRFVKSAGDQEERIDVR